MPDDTAQEAGARLKSAREAKGISLRQISDATKISSLALQHMERGDVSKLPGGIYARAFVRSYATHVGLDADKVVAEFFAPAAEAEHSRAADRADQPQESPFWKWKQWLMAAFLIPERSAWSSVPKRRAGWR